MKVARRKALLSAFVYLGEILLVMNSKKLIMEIIGTSLPALSSNLMIPPLAVGVSSWRQGIVAFNFKYSASLKSRLVLSWFVECRQVLAQ